MQDSKKQLDKQISELEDTIRKGEREQKEQIKKVDCVRKEMTAKDDEIEKNVKQAKRLADMNEELRALFDEERKAMVEEQDRLEEET